MNGSQSSFFRISGVVVLATDLTNRRLLDHNGVGPHQSTIQDPIFSLPRDFIVDKDHTAYLVVGLEKVHHELLEADGIAWWGPITCAGGVAMFQKINGPKPTPLLWWQHRKHCPKI